MPNVRQQVMAEIIKIMAEAQARGEDGFVAARAAFPGVPAMVLGEARAELAIAEEERWWETLERTIDGEVIRTAVTAIAPAASPVRASAPARRGMPARREPELDDLPIPF